MADSRELPPIGTLQFILHVCVHTDKNFSLYMLDIGICKNAKGIFSLLLCQWSGTSGILVRAFFIGFILFIDRLFYSVLDILSRHSHIDFHQKGPLLGNVIIT